MPGSAAVKNQPANAGDSGSILESEGSSAEGDGIPPPAPPPSILAWEIPWTEEPGGATVHEVTKNLDLTE